MAGSDPDRPGSGAASPPRPALGRRDLLRLGGAAAAGALLIRGVASSDVAATGPRREGGRPPGTPPVEVLPTCIGCLACVAVCPPAVIQPIPGAVTVQQNGCVSCGYCVAACPLGAIAVRRPRQPGEAQGRGRDA